MHVRFKQLQELMARHDNQQEKAKALAKQRKSVLYILNTQLKAMRKQPELKDRNKLALALLLFNALDDMDLEMRTYIWNEWNAEANRQATLEQEEEADEDLLKELRAAVDLVTKFTGGNMDNAECALTYCEELGESQGAAMARDYIEGNK